MKCVETLSNTSSDLGISDIHGLMTYRLKVSHGNVVVDECLFNRKLNQKGYNLATQAW